MTTPTAAGIGYFKVPINFFPDMLWLLLLCFIVYLNSAGIDPPCTPRPDTTPPLTGFFFIFLT
jgi:hypothetical protein